MSCFFDTNDQPKNMFESATHLNPFCYQNVCPFFLRSDHKKTQSLFEFMVKYVLVLRAHLVNDHAHVEWRQLPLHTNHEALFYFAVNSPNLHTSY